MKECPLHDMKLLQMQPVLKDTGLYLKYIGFMAVLAITEHHGIRIVSSHNCVAFGICRWTPWSRDVLAELRSEKRFFFFFFHQIIQFFSIFFFYTSCQQDGSDMENIL